MHNVVVQNALFLFNTISREKKLEKKFVRENNWRNQSASPQLRPIAHNKRNTIDRIRMEPVKQPGKCVCVYILFIYRRIILFRISAIFVS